MMCNYCRGVLKPGERYAYVNCRVYCRTCIDNIGFTEEFLPRWVTNGWTIKFLTVPPESAAPADSEIVEELAVLSQVAAGAVNEIAATTPGVAPLAKSAMAALMEQVFDELRALRAAGQAEYAHDEGNALQNFDAVGQDLDLHRAKVLWVYAKKHQQGIVAHFRGHRSQREDVRGRINDLIVYLILLRGMVEAESQLKKEMPR